MIYIIFCLKHVYIYIYVHTYAYIHLPIQSTNVSRPSPAAQEEELRMLEQLRAMERRLRYDARGVDSGKLGQHRN